MKLFRRFDGTYMLDNCRAKRRNLGLWALAAPPMVFQLCYPAIWASLLWPGIAAFYVCYAFSAAIFLRSTKGRRPLLFVLLMAILLPMVSFLANSLATLP